MLKAKLNADGTAELSFGSETATYTATELDEQIERLGRIRAQMPEKVPEQPSLIETVVFNPRYAVRTDNMTKGSLLRIRHGGYGWLNFEFPPNEALNMRKMWKDIVENLDLEHSNGMYSGPERRTTKPH